MTILTPGAFICATFAATLATIDQEEPAEQCWHPVVDTAVELEVIHTFHRDGFRFFVARFALNGATRYTYWQEPEPTS